MDWEGSCLEEGLGVATMQVSGRRAFAAGFSGLRGFHRAEAEERGEDALLGGDFADERWRKGVGHPLGGSTAVARV
jgi:hypothetical protein